LAAKLLVELKVPPTTQEYQRVLGALIATHADEARLRGLGRSAVLEADGTGALLWYLSEEVSLDLFEASTLVSSEVPYSRPAESLDIVEGELRSMVLRELKAVRQGRLRGARGEALLRSALGLVTEIGARQHVARLLIALTIPLPALTAVHICSSLDERHFGRLRANERSIWVLEKLLWSVNRFWGSRKGDALLALAGNLNFASALSIWCREEPGVLIELVRESDPEGRWLAAALRTRRVMPDVLRHALAAVRTSGLSRDRLRTIVEWISHVELARVPNPGLPPLPMEHVYWFWKRIENGLQVPERPSAEPPEGSALRFAELPIASPATRAGAAAVDLGVIFIGNAACVALLAWARIVHVGIDKTTLTILVAGMILGSATYWTTWALLRRRSIGMRWAGLALRTFDGRSPTRPERIARVLANLLGFSAVGLGQIWILMDEEALSWADHMSRTFPTPDPDASL